ncbi:MAG: Fe-S cluster assembly protein IscX [Bacteroidota bacterium]
MKWTWRDVQEIAAGLAEAHPETDPLSVPLPELKRIVSALPSFGDDPDATTDAILEAIQAAWYDEMEG